MIMAAQGRIPSPISSTVRHSRPAELLAGRVVGSGSMAVRSRRNAVQVFSDSGPFASSWVQPLPHWRTSPTLESAHCGLRSRMRRLYGLSPTTLPPPHTASHSSAGWPLTPSNALDSVSKCCYSPESCLTSFLVLVSAYVKDSFC